MLLKLRWLVVYTLLLGLLLSPARGRAAGATAATGGGGNPAAVGADGLRPDTGVSLLGATARAEVYIDGEKVGTTPLPDVIKLGAGEHTIRVVRPGFAPYIDVFKVRDGKVTRIEVELVPIAGVLQIKASVDKARVFVDNKFVGETPLSTELKVGPHEVKVAHFGYQDAKLAVSAVAGEVLERDVMLIELPAGQNPYKQAAPKARWFEKWWVWTLGAAGVAAVAVAIIVPTVYASRSVCQRLNADVCIPISSSGTQGLMLAPAASPAPSLGLTWRF